MAYIPPKTTRQRLIEFLAQNPWAMSGQNTVRASEAPQRQFVTDVAKKAQDSRDAGGALEAISELLHAPKLLDSTQAAAAAWEPQGGGDKLEAWDGIGRQILSLDTTPLVYWSRHDAPRTFEFTWRGVAPLPTGPSHRGLAGLSFPAVEVVVKLSDPRDVGAYEPVTIREVVTPQSIEGKPVRVALPYGGDVEVHLNALQTTPRGAQLMVTNYASSRTR